MTWYAVLELTPYSRYELSRRGGYEDCDDLEKARSDTLSAHARAGEEGEN